MAKQRNAMPTTKHGLKRLITHRQTNKKREIFQVTLKSMLHDSLKVYNLENNGRSYSENIIED